MKHFTKEEIEERLIDKVPSRCYHYLLDWNEKDNYDTYYAN